MKILAIRGKNLASLTGEFEVNFRNEPLRSAGLFAITGSTGSGKTTILDTMCIALYEKTPRLESIKDSEAIEKHGEKGIFENDTKTILSKGCHSGYAEVEFLAVDNKEYRVRWSISRAGDKADGNFRKTTYDVFNLTDDTHVAYKTKEYRSLVPKLVGLTYEEFTRAVLLSQGNFAAFLKASEKDKAAILQKLTGTEIYNRISSIIYRRYSEARQDLGIIEAQMNGMALLSPEQLDEINSRIKELDVLNARNEEKVTLITAQKQWIERMMQLENELAESVKEYEDVKLRMQQAAPVAERLKRIESVQDIRDVYIQKGAVVSQHKEATVALASLREGMASAAEALTDAQEKARQAEELVAKVQKEYDCFKPKIKDAIKLEEQINGDETRLKDCSEEKKVSENEYLKQESLLSAEQEILKKSSNEANEIEEWFKQHEAYGSIVPNIPVIVSNIRVMADTRSHIHKLEKTLSVSKSKLAECEANLIMAREKEDGLAGILSQEIAELRNRLVDGEPCPVCGSRTHLITRNEQKTLAETELEKARECIKKSIEQYVQSIEEYKDSITKLQSSIETLGDTVARLKGNCAEMLKGVADGNEIISKEDTALLTDLAEKWDMNSRRLTTLKEEILVKSKSIEHSTSRIEEIGKRLEVHIATISSTEEKIKKSREQLSSMLGTWHSCEEAERHFENSVSNANKAFSIATDSKVTAANNYNKLKGNIEEKENLITGLENKEKELSFCIDTYLSARPDGMEYTELESLLSPNNDIGEMRTHVEDVKKALLKATATLDERKRKISEHEKADARPQDSGIEDIIAAMGEALAYRAALSEEKSMLNATLLKDQEDNGRFSLFRAEYEAKKKSVDDWGELNTAFGSADGNKLTRLTQGYTLDILLDVANMHLREFSGRYILSRISQDSLGIKVIDLEMMSDTRSVHTLSGGETFLASLALSLALSSVSSNRMNIESLFIDEGFGALDGDTLREAIDVLEKLQTTGRKIGVISHLGEMLQRIPTRIRVLKTGNGKSRIITE